MLPVTSGIPQQWRANITKLATQSDYADNIMLDMLQN